MRLRSKRRLEILQRLETWERERKMVFSEPLLRRSIPYPPRGVALKNSCGVLSGLLLLVSCLFLVLVHLSRIKELAKVV